MAVASPLSSAFADAVTTGMNVANDVVVRCLRTRSRLASAILVSPLSAMDKGNYKCASMALCNSTVLPCNLLV